MNIQQSFWESDSFFKPYDLIIVGAGLTGLSAALFFKKATPEARVCVLEKGFVPQGASTRNAGFACFGSVTEHLADLEKESPEKVKERINQRLRGLSLLIKTLGDDAIRYNNCGGYELFTSQVKFEAAATEIERFNTWMNDLVQEKEVYQTGEFEGYPVIYNRLEGALHPGKMMYELARKVTEEGVEIKWNASVRKVKENALVILENGVKLRAEKVLYATNGFLKELFSDIKITPARGFVFITNELKQQPWKGIFHHRRGYTYFRNVGNRLLIGGARDIALKQEKTDKFGVNCKIQAYLESFVNDTLKLSDDWKIEQKWSGIMGFTPTKTPIVKQLDDRRFVAAGLSGMGIAIGMQVGKKAAALMTNK